MNYKKIKIILFIADASVSGGPIQVLHLVSGLNKKQFDILVVSPKGFLSKELAKLKIPYKEFDFKKGLFQVKKLQKLIAPEIDKRTIFHVHGVTAGHFVKLANRKFKNILIYTEHNWTSNYHLKSKLREKLQLFLLKKLSRYTTLTVCVSQAVQEFLIHKNIVTQKNSIVIYNGVKFPRIIKRKNISNPVILGTVASLEKRKGIVYLLEAIAKLKNDKQFKKRIVLKIMGKGSEEGFLKQHAVDLGINFDIQWLGVNPDLSTFWSSIDVYVQPSLDESFGMAVAEAMGAKIPVVATQTGGLPEVVGQYGILVRSESSKDLALAIKRVVTNKVQRQDNVNNGYNHVKQEFSIENMVKNYTNLYKNYFKDVD